MSITPNQTLLALSDLPTVTDTAVEPGTISLITEGLELPDGTVELPDGSYALILSSPSEARLAALVVAAYRRESIQTARSAGEVAVDLGYLADAVEHLRQVLAAPADAETGGAR